MGKISQTSLLVLHIVMLWNILGLTIKIVMKDPCVRFLCYQVYLIHIYA